MNFMFSSYFSHAYVGQDYSIQKNVGKISLEQIDSVSYIDHLLLKCQIWGVILSLNEVWIVVVVQSQE